MNPLRDDYECYLDLNDEIILHHGGAHIHYDLCEEDEEEIHEVTRGFSDGEDKNKTGYA